MIQTNALKTKVTSAFASKKGQSGVFAFLIGGVLGLAVLGLIIVFTLAMLGKVDDNFVENSAEWNASRATTSAVDDVPDYLPLLVIGIIFVALIAFVVAIWARTRGAGGGM